MWFNYRDAWTTSVIIMLSKSHRINTDCPNYVKFALHLCLIFTHFWSFYLLANIYGLLTIKYILNLALTWGEVANFQEQTGFTHTHYLLVYTHAAVIAWSCVLTPVCKPASNFTPAHILYIIKIKLNIYFILYMRITCLLYTSRCV